MSINFPPLTFSPLGSPFSRNPGFKRVKTPTLLQMEATECGAASLGIILGYYGRFVPLAQLRRDCGVSRDGAKASKILTAARSYGLEAKGYQKGLASLLSLAPPYIVFWSYSHFIVVEKFAPRYVYVNDPAFGRRRMPQEEFQEGYTGITLVIRPGANFIKGGERVNVLSSLRSRLAGATGALAYCMLAGFFLTLIGLVIPVFTQVFIDEILIAGHNHWLKPLLSGLAIAGLLQAWLTFLRLKYLRRLKAKLALMMSSRFLWHLLHLPVSFYTQRFAGEITHRITLNDQVADTLSGKLASTLIDALMVVFYVGVMVQYDGLLTGIVVGFALLNVFALQTLARKRVDANQRLIQEYGKVAGISIAALQNIETLKASGLEADVFGRWAGQYTKALAAQQDLEVSNQFLSVLPTLLSAVSTLLLLVMGSCRVIDGHLSIGMLVAFQALSQNFQQPINTLVTFGSTLQELEGQLLRLDDVLNNPVLPASPEEEDSPALAAARLSGSLELEGITFGYNRLEPPLIENFSLSLKPGQRVAIVGATGSGKSTIARIVSGLYQPWTGRVLFDGKPKEEIPALVINHSLAMVEQDLAFFAGSVRDNLTLWDRTVPEKNLVKACQDAVLDAVIKNLPCGYDGELLEGAMNLSGGQRQRLEIARALVNNPSILILDEATSALDAQTEKLIDENLRRRGCTCLIVAHRLSTIRDCDEIIVLDGGKVVQRGTHEELRHRPGIYQQLLRTEGETL